MYVCDPLFRQMEVHLLEKMKFNCQVFKEEISMVHLNRQAAQLQNALQESDVKVVLNLVRIRFMIICIAAEFIQQVEGLEL